MSTYSKIVLTIIGGYIIVKLLLLLPPSPLGDRIGEQIRKYHERIEHLCR